MKAKLDMVFGGGRVKRYHTRDTITQQNNAEHSYGVASLVALIKPDCSKALLLHALWHDIWEVETGDIPAYVKVKHPAIKNLLNEIEYDLAKLMPIIPLITVQDTALLKMCDCYETLMYCEKEQRMGNSALDCIIKNCKQKIKEINRTYPCPILMEMLLK